jgi:hypothetical protein
MGIFSLFRYGIILQAIAIIHFIRRRPDTYWLWIIIFGQGLGAMVYIAVEVLPDAPLLVRGFQVFPRRSRIKRLEAMVMDNPSAGNYEELAALYYEDKRYQKALDAYNRAISTRTDSPDPFYRRALCALELKDYAAAEADLRRVIASDPNYDYQRAKGLLADTLARLGHAPEADALFNDTLRTSTLSETMTNYADFLRSQDRSSEAREWAQRVLAKKHTLPSYLKRRERPWFRRASGLLKQLPS